MLAFHGTGKVQAHHIFDTSHCIQRLATEPEYGNVISLLFIGPVILWFRYFPAINWTSIKLSFHEVFFSWKYWRTWLLPAEDFLLSMGLSEHSHPHKFGNILKIFSSPKAQMHVSRYFAYIVFWVSAYHWPNFAKKATSYTNGRLHKSTMWSNSHCMLVLFNSCDMEVKQR